MRSSRLPLPKLLAATVAACALLPAAAQAASVGLENGTLTYRGQGSEPVFRSRPGHRDLDAIDTVTNCEVVNKGGAAGTAAGAGGKGTAGTKAKGLTIVGAAKIKRLLAGRLAVNVPCAAACRVTVTAKAAGKTVATGRKTLLKAGTAKVTLKATKKAKRALNHATRVKLTIGASVAGATGKPVKLTKSLTLKR